MMFIVQALLTKIDIYNHNMFIVKATTAFIIKLLGTFSRPTGPMEGLESSIISLWVKCSTTVVPQHFTSYKFLMLMIVNDTEHNDILEIGQNVIDNYAGKQLI